MGLVGAAVELRRGIEVTLRSHRDHIDVSRRSLSTPRQHDSIGACVELSATSALRVKLVPPVP